MGGAMGAQWGGGAWCEWGAPQSYATDNGPPNVPCCAVGLKLLLVSGLKTNKKPLNIGGVITIHLTIKQNMFKKIQLTIFKAMDLYS